MPNNQQYDMDSLQRRGFYFGFFGTEGAHITSWQCHNLSSALWFCSVIWFPVWFSLSVVSSSKRPIWLIGMWTLRKSCTVNVFGIMVERCDWVIAKAFLVLHFLYGELLVSCTLNIASSSIKRWSQFPSWLKEWGRVELDQF